MATDERPALTYEQARAELSEVVQKLEAGGTTLEESLQLWERGEELARTCQDWLEGARARLRQAMAERTDAEPGTDEQPADNGGGNGGEGAPPF
ncbi:MAG: exodeoxyribonuclease VII small subunit [Streptosporangiales bacterium]